jgi:mannose-6-phosphate isomerase-like protein (cupin superfamily)
MHVRRVVTGQGEQGATVVSDELLPPITGALFGASEFHRIWGSDTPARLPSDGAEPAAEGYFPPTPGYRFGFFTLGPEGGGVAEDFDLTAALAEVNEKLPGMVDVLEPDHPGMHTTDTVDFIVVLSGEVVLELDNGEETALRAGDTVIQNGTRHAWHNRSAEPCVMAVAIVGAART